MRFKRFLIAALTLVIAWCGLGLDAALAAYDMPYYIEVDLTSQIVTIYNTRDDTIARQMLCSAGIQGSTPTGVYYLEPKVLDTERTEWFYMKSYATWVMYATRIMGSYFFHSIPFQGHYGRMSPIAASKLGMPASHGCIRLRVEDAAFIAQNCMPGTRVRILKSGDKRDELRALLYISSFGTESGLTYQEFLGYSADDLGLGSVGEDVRELQLRLHDLGYFGGDINGEYRNDTLVAVKTLQKDLGLAQSGVTSAELREVIFSSGAPVSAGQITLQEGSSGPVVKKLQTALKDLLLYDGDIDSVYDVDVVAAVKELQRMCGYSADGVATPEQQHLAYYEVDRLKRELGEGYTVERITEPVNMATMTYEQANIFVRSRPDTRSDPVAKLSLGDQVVVLAVQDEWAQVFAGGSIGYMYTKYLTPFVSENYVLKYTGSDGNSITIGSTVAEMTSGTGRSEQAEFRNYYTSVQYESYLDETVEYATVNTGDDDVRLKMRAEGSADAEVLAEVPNGTKLRVLASDDEWTRVGYDDKIGYLMNQYVTFSEGNASEVEDTTDALEKYITAEDNITGVVVPTSESGRVPVYGGAGEDSGVIGHLPGTCPVQIVSIDEDSGWVLIDYQGHQGYMRDENLSFRLGD